MLRSGYHDEFLAHQFAAPWRARPAVTIVLRLDRDAVARFHADMRKVAAAFDRMALDAGRALTRFAENLNRTVTAEQALARQRNAQAIRARDPFRHR